MKSIFLVCLLFAQTLVFGVPKNDHPNYFNGVVIDQITGETLAGVEVRIKGTNTVVYTDAEGRFFLNDLSEGEFSLEFHYLMYADKVLNLQVASLSSESPITNNTVSISLEPR